LAERARGLIRLSKDQVGPASEVLTRAFFRDSKLTYLLPDEAARRELARHLFGFEIRYGMNYGRVYATSPGLEGLAVWLPSEKSEVTFWRAFRSGGMGLQKGLGKEAMDRLLSFSALVDEFHKKHAPDPHCYLFFIGVAPSFQGKGFGSRLIRPVLAALDRKKTACYLNTQNEKNISVYEHFGFQVVEQVTLPGTGIVHTGMLRKTAKPGERGAGRGIY
jgi:ribosomal protein S18 acetylase RimI-like enzyme